MEPEKPSFRNFIEGIPEETLEQRLGYVDPEGNSQLILNTKSKPIITCIQENAVCSPERLGENLKLRTRQVDLAITAHPGDRGLQIRRVICCWIEANQSTATVRALLEGLWQSDDTKALACVQGLEVVQASRRKATLDLNAPEEMPMSVLPPGSKLIPASFHGTDPLYHNTVVAMPNGTLKTRSHHLSDSTTEDSVQETVQTVPPTGKSVPVLPSYPLKREEMPLELARQEPHEATESSLTSTETEIVAVSEFHSIKPSQESIGEVKEEISRLTENLREVQLQTIEVTKKSTENEMRIGKLEEENQKLSSQLKDKMQEIEKLHQKIRELEDNIELLRTECEVLKKRLQDKHEECEELKKRVKEKDEEISDKDRKMKQLEEELRDRNQEIQQLKRLLEEGGKQPIEDVDTFSSIQAGSTSIPREDFVIDEGTMNPEEWIIEKDKMLGKGRFGKVYLSHHEVYTTELLAVKVIDVEICGNTELNSFKREVLALRHKVPKHHRIVRYVGIDVDVTTRGCAHALTLHMFMEYMPGGTLHQYTKKHGGMELSHVQKCTRQLLEGVAHLHKSNCVHRDIKGPNILRDSEGNIKLADFGCTKTLEDIDNDGKMSHDQGTIYWRAPETIKTTPESLPRYDFDSDIWSVGATVIEMITGEHPYPSYEPLTVVYTLGSDKHYKTPFDVCKIQEPDQQMVTFLSHCFQRKPSDRLSAQELLQTSFVTEN